MVLSRTLIGVGGAVAAALIGVPGVAAAQPTTPPPPPAPNVNAFDPVKPSEFAVMDGQWYAFSTPQGATCVLQRSGSYGCSGNLPGAPGGANLVSGAMGGVPGFATAAGDVFATIGGEAAKPLPANTRLSYQTVSCGTDGTMTACIDSRNQAGFVISPSGSAIVNATNPLLDRPEGTNPFMN